MPLFSRKPATVDQAVAVLMDTIKNLESVSENRYDSYTRKIDEAEAIKVDAERDLAESTRAKKIRNKLTAILED